jgi:hypothetical protein
MKPSGASTYAGLVSDGSKMLENGYSRTAFVDFAQAYALDSSQPEAAQAILNEINGGSLPVRLPKTALDMISSAGGPVSVFTLPNCDVTIVASKADLKIVYDPMNQWPFVRALWFYRKDDADPSQLICYAGIRAQHSSDEPLAQRIGSLLYLLREVMLEKSGYAPLTDGQPFTVWLSRPSGDGGGEQWRNNIYIYGIEDERSSIEWIRETAHEFSHLAFPIVGGDYTAPEAWANGYIGERLLLRWIAKGAYGGPPRLEKVWGETFSGYSNFDRKLITPPLNLFARIHLNKTWLERRDANGMDYLIGALLTIDDVSGANTCAQLLWSLPQGAVVDPVQLYPAFQKALSISHKQSEKKRSDK